MKRIVIAFLSILLLGGLGAQTAAAADARITTMVNIVMHLQHYPSDQEIQTLKQITTDPQATAGERTLAGALMRMRHTVGADDATKLQDLKADPEASSDERKLAGILLGIAHHPSAEDQKQLQLILKGNN